MALPALLRGLPSPKARVVAVDAMTGLPARFGIDPPAAKLLRKGLSPAKQIGLPRVQAPAVLGFGADADVNVGVGLVVA